MKDMVIESWCQLQEELFQGSWNPELSRYRSPFVFRGLSDVSYGLTTTLMRLGGQYNQLERHIIRNFRKYAQSVAGEHRSFWHLLTVAQHHGLPTRLLDWTYSPLVAAHFATANIDKLNVDGVIWVVNFQMVHEQLPNALQDLLRREGAQAFTVELLASFRNSGDPFASEERSFHQLEETLNEFDAIGEKTPFALFFEPPSINERIVNQFALFSVMPDATRRIDEWLGGSPELFRRIIIPARLKSECRDKLDQCNITERVLFPGLDGLSSWLKRHYTPIKGTRNTFLPKPPDCNQCAPNAPINTDRKRGV